MQVKEAKFSAVSYGLKFIMDGFIFLYYINPLWKKMQHIDKFKVV